MLMVQGEMAHPTGGNPITQRVGQIAAGRHAARRYLHQKLSQTARQIGRVGESFGRIGHEGAALFDVPQDSRNIGARIAGGKGRAPCIFHTHRKSPRYPEG